MVCFHFHRNRTVCIDKYMNCTWLASDNIAFHVFVTSSGPFNMILLSPQRFQARPAATASRDGLAGLLLSETCAKSNRKLHVALFPWRWNCLQLDFMNLPSCAPNNIVFDVFWLFVMASTPFAMYFAVSAKKSKPTSCETEMGWTACLVFGKTCANRRLKAHWEANASRALWHFDPGANTDGFGARCARGKVLNEEGGQHG